MRRNLFCWSVLLATTVAPVHAEVPVSLRGSPESMVRQNGVARDHELIFVQSPAELRALAESGDLVSLEGNADYEIADFVSYPHARPEMKTFIERLAAQYRAATGEKLVVTSLTRPASRQPRNSHQLSVHPTGIAVDLRVSQRAASRQWLENTLLSLEDQGLLDVTRERYPPHYHVALFPVAYMAHVEKLLEKERAEQLARAEQLDVMAMVGAHPLAEPVADQSEPPRQASSLAVLIAVLLTLPIAWWSTGRRRPGGKRTRGD